MNEAQTALSRQILKLITKTLAGERLLRKGKSWYVRSDETVCVLNLQMSQYAPLYYVNFGIFLSTGGPASNPPAEFKADIRLRLEQLLADDRQAEFNTLFNLETAMDDSDRLRGIEAFIRQLALPLINRAATKDGVATLLRQEVLKPIMMSADARLLFQIS